MKSEGEVYPQKMSTEFVDGKIRKITFNIVQRMAFFTIFPPPHHSAINFNLNMLIPENLVYRIRGDPLSSPFNRVEVSNKLVHIAAFGKYRARIKFTYLFHV